VRILVGMMMGVLLGLAVPSIHAKEGGGEGGEKSSEAGPQYVPLDSVLVNLDGRRHYLRVDIQILVESGEQAEKIKTHMPAIRDKLILLFSGRNPEQISEVPEREKLRQSAKSEIQKVLERYHAGKGLKDVFFTDFMIQ
jgi:flagellar protein FliL